jgi:hypothetical protein
MKHRPYTQKFLFYLHGFRADTWLHSVSNPVDTEDKTAEAWSLLFWYI